MKTTFIILLTLFAPVVFSATLDENVTQVENSSTAIDSAIRAKRGTTDGGLVNAAAGILSIPDNVQPMTYNYVAWSNGVHKIVEIITNTPPYRYKLVEYLQSSDGQYINLGVNASGDTKLKMKLKNMTTAYTQAGIFGDRSSGSARYGVHLYQRNYDVAYYNSWYIGVATPSTDSDDIIEIRDNNVFVNDISVRALTYGNFTSSSLYIFQQNTWGSSEQFSGRIYYVQLTNLPNHNDMYLIPALGENDTPCFIDINDNFQPYFNVGTGSFQYSAVTNVIKDTITTNITYITVETPYILTVTNPAAHSIIIDDGVKFIQENILEAK